MIRYVKKEDFERIYELGSLLTPNFEKKMNLSEIMEEPYTKVLVYEEKCEVQGFLMYTELPDIVDIIDIVVAEDYRQKKIASCLLDYMFTEIKESVELITLEVRENNTAAIKLYEKFGFSIVNTRKKYYGDENAYLMGRRLEK